MAVPGMARWRAGRGRTAASPTSDDHDLEIHAYDSYRSIEAALGAGRLRDRVVAEIGPGDHIPAALLFLAAGARTYLCFDRFPGDISGPAAKAFYARLAADLSHRAPELAATLRERGIDVPRFPEAYPELVRVVPSSIEEAESDPDLPIDVITSTNVVEHVFDLEAFAVNSRRLLTPGGIAVHRVDFSAHDVWRARPDPLEWLTIPDTLWRLMGSRRGSPNRRRFHEVQDALTNAGFRVESDVLDRFPEEQVRTCRHTLARRFRDMPIDSLRVMAAKYVCA